MTKKKSSLLEAKEFPTNYPDDAVAILNAMSFGPGLKIVGSMSLRSQQYAGDYDGYEIVEKKGPLKKSLRELREKFQSIVKELKHMPNVFIGDIKSGTVEEWRVIPREARIVGGKVEGYNYLAATTKVYDLLRSKIITKEEAKECAALLKKTLTPAEFMKAKASIKFHILRWTPHEVMANALKLRDGSTITLEEAFQTPAITKLDVVGWVQNNRFTDFSVIYEFRNNGKVLNPDPIDIEPSLKADIAYYYQSGKYFKALKRRFALAKYRGDLSTIAKLTPILNSDLGRLYHITGDIGTLINLLENPSVPLADIKLEIDQFIGRLSNIYALSDYLKAEPQIIAEIHRILRLPKTKLIPALEGLSDRLDTMLQKNTLEIMGAKELKGGMFLNHGTLNAYYKGADNTTSLPGKAIEGNLRLLAHDFDKKGMPISAFGARVLADDFNEFAYGTPNDAAHITARNTAAYKAIVAAINYFLSHWEPQILKAIRDHNFRTDGRRKAVEFLGLVPSGQKYPDIQTNPAKYAG